MLELKFISLLKKVRVKIIFESTKIICTKNDVFVRRATMIRTCSS